MGWSEDRLNWTCWDDYNAMLDHLAAGDGALHAPCALHMLHAALHAALRWDAPPAFLPTAPPPHSLRHTHRRVRREPRGHWGHTLHPGNGLRVFDAHADVSAPELGAVGGLTGSDRRCQPYLASLAPGRPGPPRWSTAFWVGRKVCCRPNMHTPAPPSLPRSAGYSVLISTSQSSSSAWIFMDAFSWPLWVALVFTAAGVGVALWLLEPWTTPRRRPSAADYKADALQAAVWNSIGRPMQARFAA